MEHIAVVISSLTGRMHSSFEMVSRLEKEGYKVTNLCQPDVLDKVKKQGFTCVQIPQVNVFFNDPKRKKIESSWFKKLAYHLKNLGNHYEEGKKILKLGKYKEILSGIAPDRILADVELHDLIFTAIELKIPVTLYHTWYSDKISLNLPPIRSSIIPGKGIKGSKIGILWAWLNIRIRVWGRIYMDIMTFNNYRRSVLKKYAKQIGFSSKHLMANRFPPHFSYTKLPIITMAMQELEFPHRPAKNLIYVGPMVYESRVENKEDPMILEELDKIFLLKKEFDKKLIYCCLSSYVTGDVIFLQKVIKAVAQEKKWILIVSLGGNLSAKELQPIPDNVYLFHWAPQLKILKQADCSINHGGKNTINECVHFSVPMLIYSGKGFDHNGNAGRIAYHGLGIIGDKDIDGSDALRENIARVLNEKSYKNKMIEYNSIYKGYQQKKLSSYLCN